MNAFNKLLNLAKNITDIMSQLGLNESNRPLRIKFDFNQGDVDKVLLIKKIEVSSVLNQGLTINAIVLSNNALISLQPFLGVPCAIDSVNDSGELIRLSGIITNAQAGGADGSLTSYRFTIQDSLSLLKQRRNSRLYLDQNVVEITQNLINEWQQGNESFKQSLELDTSGLTEEYPRQSFTQQINETDYQFITRLWASYGINFWIEAAEPVSSYSRYQPSSNNLKQILKLSDNSNNWTSSITQNIAFQRSNATETADTITALVARRYLTSQNSNSHSWDLSQNSLSQSNSEGQQHNNLVAGLLEDNLSYSSLHKEDDSSLNLLDANRQAHHNQNSKVFEALGSIRDAQVGHYIQINGHPELDTHDSLDKQFNIIGIQYVAVNNLPKELLQQSDTLLQFDSTNNQNNSNISNNPNLQITINSPQRHIAQLTLQRKSINLKPAYNPYTDKPQVQSLLATVVGPDGEEVYVDAIYRVQVKFNHLREQEHTTQGGRGSNNKDGDSAWIPVLTPFSGKQHGMSFIPRIGETVLIQFIAGDIDRPYIAGRIYHEQNLPAQFSHTGDLPNNRYMSGIVSKEIQGTRANQLKFDDTTGQISAQLHSEEQTSELNLGYNTTPRNKDAKHRGTGFELRTDEQGAVRAPKGLIITTDAQPQAGGVMLERKQAISNLRTGLANHKTLQKLEGSHLVDAIDTSSQENTLKQLQDLEGSQEPLISINSGEGLVISSGKEMAISSNDNIDIASQGSVQISSIKNYIAGALEKVSIFAHQMGIKIKAGKGKVEIEAQSDAMSIASKKMMHIYATEDIVKIESGKGILLTSGNAFIEIANGNITIGAPGKVDIKGAVTSVKSGASYSSSLGSFPESKLDYDEKFILRYTNGEPMANMKYKIKRADGTIIQGVSDEQGHTDISTTQAMQNIAISILGSADKK